MTEMNVHIHRVIRLINTINSSAIAGTIHGNETITIQETQAHAVIRTVQNTVVEAVHHHTVRKVIRDIIAAAADRMVIVLATTTTITVDLIDPGTSKIHWLVQGQGAIHANIHSQSTPLTNIHTTNSMQAISQNWINTKVIRRLNVRNRGQRAYHTTAMQIQKVMII